MDTVPVTVRFPKEIVERATHLAKENGYVNMQDVIRTAVREYVESKSNTSVERRAIYRGQHTVNLPHKDKM